MTNYILIVAAIILLCLFLNKISAKLGIPVLLAFILLGMLFGTDGLLKISFDNYQIGGADLYGFADLYYVLRRLWNELEAGETGGGKSSAAFHAGCAFDGSGDRDFLLGRTQV